MNAITPPRTLASITTWIEDPPLDALSGFPLILLNGPPGCGKDTGALALQLEIEHLGHLKMSDHLKRSVFADFGLPTDLPLDIFDPIKDEPSPIFGGLSFRQALIHKSEVQVKPKFGKDFYGRQFVRKLWREHKAGMQMAVVSDCGFAEEWTPVLDVVGPESVLLVRVRAEGRGKNFKSDSRSYISLDGVTTIELENNEPGDPRPFRTDLIREVNNWLDLKLGLGLAAAPAF